MVSRWPRTKFNTFRIGNAQEVQGMYNYSLALPVMVSQGMKSESRELAVGQGQGLGWAGLVRLGKDRGGLARLDRGGKTGDQRQREMWLYWIKIQDVV
jgi:hypothetical protein